MTDEREHPKNSNRTASQMDTPTLQEAAVQLIAELGRESVASYLENRISEVTDFEKRFELIASYLALERERAYLLLQQLAMNPSEPSEMRTACLHRLAKTGSSLAVKTVGSALLDRDQTIRVEALRLVAFLPRTESIQLLELALKDKLADIHAMAASMLLKMRAVEAVDAIGKYFIDHPKSPDAKRAKRFVQDVRASGEYDQLYGEY